MESRTFDTLELCQTAAMRLSEDGWSVVPFGEPDRAVRGWMCFRMAGDVRRGDRRPEEVVRLSFALYGDVSPVRTVFEGWREWVQALRERASSDMERCDDPRAGQVGFVSYARASEGVTEVFLVPADVLREGALEAQEALLAVWRETGPSGSTMTLEENNSECGILLVQELCSSGVPSPSPPSK